MTYLIKLDTFYGSEVCHVTYHMSLVHLLSTLLQAVCRPLLPGCEFWCGRVQLLTRQAKLNSFSAVSPWSTSCEGCFLTFFVMFWCAWKHWQGCWDTSQWNLKSQTRDRPHRRPARTFSGSYLLGSSYKKTSNIWASLHMLGCQHSPTLWYCA